MVTWNRGSVSHNFVIPSFIVLNRLVRCASLPWSQEARCGCSLPILWSCDLPSLMEACTIDQGPCSWVQQLYPVFYYGFQVDLWRQNVIGRRLRQGIVYSSLRLWLMFNTRRLLAQEWNLQDPGALSLARFCFRATIRRGDPRSAEWRIVLPWTYYSGELLSIRYPWIRRNDSFLRHWLSSIHLEQRLWPTRTTRMWSELSSLATYQSYSTLFEMKSCNHSTTSFPPKEMVCWILHSM